MQLFSGLGNLTKMALGKISEIVKSSNIDTNLIDEVLDGLRDVFQKWVDFIIIYSNK